MSKSKKEIIPEWAKTGHKKPVTRRDFLAHGMIPFAASAFMPNWLQFLSPESALAQAVVCPTGGTSMVPFFHLNLEGGAGLAANYVPMNAGRDLIGQAAGQNGYNIIGLGRTPVIQRVFNNAPFAGNGVSNILTGILANTQTATQNNTAFIGFCTQSRDDSSENNYSPAGMIQRAGLVGTKLPAMGNRDSNTGINQRPAVFSPQSPLIVKSFNDIANSLGYTAGLAGLNQAQKEKLTKLVGDLNNSQARKLAAINQGSQIQEMLHCVGVKNNQLVAEGSAAVDPRSNAAVAALWGLAANTAANNESFILGAQIYNVLLGQSGPGSFSKGGYDYHGNDRATVTNVRDRNAGDIIGKLLDTARILQRPLALMVTTDGAVSSDASDTPDSNFNSDRGSAGMTYLFMYHPTARPVTTDFQVGHYTNGQSADTSFISGGSPELTAQAVFLNWLKLNNRMDLYTQVVPTGRAMDAAGVAQVVKVG